MEWWETAWQYALAIRDWIPATAACIGVGIAWQGLKTWKKQLRGISQFELAKKILVHARRLKRDMVFFYSLANDIPYPSDNASLQMLLFEKSTSAYIESRYKERYDEISERYVEMELLVLEFEVLLDKENNEILDNFAYALSCLQLKLHIYFEYVNKETDELGIIKNPSGDFSKSFCKPRYTERAKATFDNYVNSAIKATNDLVKPYLHK